MIAEAAYELRMPHAADDPIGATDVVCRSARARSETAWFARKDKDEKSNSTLIKQTWSGTGAPSPKLAVFAMVGNSVEALVASEEKFRTIRLGIGQPSQETDDREYMTKAWDRISSQVP